MSLTPTDEEGGSQIDVVVESEEENISNRLSLIKIVSRFDERDRELINLRFYKNKTQTETAKTLNMTQVQVSRREKKLLSIIREKMLI